MAILETKLSLRNPQPPRLTLNHPIYTCYVSLTQMRDHTLTEDPTTTHKSLKPQHLPTLWVFRPMRDHTLNPEPTTSHKLIKAQHLPTLRVHGPNKVPNPHYGALNHSQFPWSTPFTYNPGPWAIWGTTPLPWSMQLPSNPLNHTVFLQCWSLSHMRDQTLTMEPTTKLSRLSRAKTQHLRQRPSPWSKDSSSGAKICPLKIR